MTTSEHGEPPLVWLSDQTGPSGFILVTGDRVLAELGPSIAHDKERIVGLHEIEQPFVTDRLLAGPRMVTF